MTMSADAILQTVFSASPLAMAILDADERILHWSRRAEELFGWRESELIGQPLPHQCRDGQPLAARWQYTAYDGGTLAVDEDAAGARAERLLQAAPDAILEVDREGRILLMNHAAERSFGYTRAELMGQPVEILVPDTVRHGHRHHRQAYGAAAKIRPMGNGLDLEAQRKDGSRFPVEISLSPSSYEGEHRVTAIIRDVSESRQVQQRLREVQAQHAREWAATNSQLEARNLEIERANRLKSEFLASMSHELRTPLHTIIGFAELLAEGLDGELNATQRRFIEHIHRDSLHLLELINDILDLSKIEAGRLELRRTTFALEEALQEVLATVRPQAAAKSQRLRVNLQDGISLEADRVRFKEILYNLLSNAVKFTNEGGAIAIEVVRGTEFARLTVEDTGIGIAPEHQEAVFEAFHQVGSTTKGVKEGTGLGLVITRRLVEQHGGLLSMESQVGRGTRFTFTIPLEPAQRGTRQQPLVLIAHEDRAVRRALGEALLAQGRQVAMVAVARDALQLVTVLRPEAIAAAPALQDPSWRDAGIPLFDLSGKEQVPVVLAALARELAQ